MTPVESILSTLDDDEVLVVHPADADQAPPGAIGRVVYVRPPPVGPPPGKAIVYPLDLFTVRDRAAGNGSAT